MHRLAIVPFALLLLLSATGMQSPRRVHAQTASYAAGWNLVAGPQGARLIGATGLLYTLGPGASTYQTEPADTPLTACEGYWAYFPTGGSIDFGPFGEGSVQCSINVSPAQFVMMGSPSATASVTVAGADVVYTYDPAAGYQAASRLAPGQGAWVYAAGPVTIQTSAPLVVPVGIAAPASEHAAPTGPRALSAALGVTTRTGGTVGASAMVADANGAGVPGAMVTATESERSTSLASAPRRRMRTA